MMLVLLDLKAKEKYPLNTICAFDQPNSDNLAIFELKFYLAEENITLTFEAASLEEAERFAEVVRARIFTMFDGTLFTFSFMEFLSELN